MAGLVEGDDLGSDAARRDEHGGPGLEDKAHGLRVRHKQGSAADGQALLGRLVCAPAMVRRCQMRRLHGLLGRMSHRHDLGGALYLFAGADFDLQHPLQALAQCPIDNALLGERLVLPVSDVSAAFCPWVDLVVNVDPHKCKTALSM